MPPVTQVSHKQVYEGPIMHSHAILLQKEVNSLLAKINFHIFENVILPKCSIVVVLRYTNKEEDITLHRTSSVKNGPIVRTSTMKNRPSVRTSTVENGPAVRNIHNYWFPEDFEVHEDILESLSSLVSNGASSKSFGLSESSSLVLVNWWNPKR